MRTELAHNPDFGMLRVTFEAPGEQIVCEAGAMVGRDSAIDMKTNLQGGIGSAIKRRLLGGESLFQNTFTSNAPGQQVLVAPPSEGTIAEIDIEPGMEIYLQSGAYLASTTGVVLDTSWQGAKGFFAGGMFLVRAAGQGKLWFSAYGGLHLVDIGPTYPGYICDNAHMVAFSQGLSYSVRKLGGIKSLIFSGEGLVCEFSGQGRVWMQTRNPAALAAFLHPFRAVGAAGG